MRKTIFLATVALAGCATAPGYRASSVTTPAVFRETRPLPSIAALPAAAASTAAPATMVPATTTLETGYWQSLGDSTLSRLINEMVRSSPDMQAAEARVRGARASRSRSLLDLAPVVTVGGSYARQRLSSAAFPGGSSGAFPDQGIYEAGFDASWEIDVFGGIRRRAEAEGAYLGAAEEDRRDVLVSLTAELARAYFDLRGNQERLAVATRNAENQQRTLEVTKQRLDAGRGTAFDTERAQAQLSSTLAAIPTYEAQVAAARYRIGVLVGRSPTEVAAELTDESGLPALPPPPNITNADSVIRFRPDVARAERQSAAQHALVGAARADYLPRLTFGGTAGYTSTDFNALGNDGTFRYAVGPMVTWAAFDLGRVKANVNATRAREDEARAAHARTVLAAVEEVETSLSRYRSALIRVGRLEEASAASERAAELARLRFTEGVSDFLQVLDAERTQLESQDRLAQSRTEAATAYAALYKALGGR